MSNRRLARQFRALRRSKHWSQRRLATQLRVSQQTMSRLELSDLGACSVKLLEAWATELNGYLAVDLRVNGQRPLTDARHARLQEFSVTQLRGDGWLVEVEPSFNQYGDRGRIDVLAFHPILPVLLVMEVKTQIDDVQAVVGRLDVKWRVARVMAAERGWQPVGFVPALVVREDRTARRRVAEHGAIFRRFALRGRPARSWLRHPKAPIPSGILLFVSLPARGP